MVLPTAILTELKGREAHLDSPVYVKDLATLWLDKTNFLRYFLADYH
jgi:hypothetical protein